MAHRLTLKQYSISVTAYTPDVYNLVAHLSGRNPKELAFTSQTLSLTGRSTVPVDPDYDRIAAAIQRGVLRDGRRVNHNANHNAVDLYRITAGVDVRTTVSVQYSTHSCSLTYLRLCFATSPTALISPS
jgi:hypothetical protein